HQRRADHGVGASQAARRTVGHRHRGRRRVPHRHATRRRGPGVEAATEVRASGMSVRLKLTLSYAGFLMVAGVLLLAVVGLFLLRYVPDGILTPGTFGPNRSDLERAFVPKAATALGLLLAFGLLGGWLLAG